MRSTIASILLLATVLSVQAQDSLLLRDYSFVKRSDPWLTSANTSALTRFASANIAEAELSLTRAKGGQVDYNDSPSVLQADAGVESFFRLSSRAVVFGGISYNNYSGDDMTGSAFLNSISLATPSSVATSAAFSAQPHLPFDIVEDSLTNPGRKHRDVYHLSGGFGIDVLRGLSLGARLDYTAANYAKYKDLRHKNKLMDLQLAAGLYWPFAQWGSIGANYLYQRTTESLDFSTYGKTDRTYKSLISYAAFTGYVEQYGDNGYTDKSHELPLVSDYNGLSAQLSIDTKPLLLYNAFTFLHRSGYYGRPSPFTITYTDHQSNLYAYDATLLLPRRKSRHRLDLHLNIENLQNRANTFREQLNDAGASYYNYYTPVKTADKLWSDLQLVFTSDLGIVGEQPSWTILLGHNWLHRKQTAYLYPYYRRQQLDCNEVFASVTRHLLCRHGVWSLMLSGSFRHGNGAPFEDMTFAEPSDKQETPATMDAHLLREYQWLTAPQYCIGGMVKYAFLMPATSLKTFARLSLSHRKANVTYDYSQGCDRTQVSLAIGCEF